MEVAPSPKVQKRVVIWPVDWSLKFTVSGAEPVVGLADPASGPLVCLAASA